MLEWTPGNQTCPHGLSGANVRGGPERGTEGFAPLVDRQGMVGVGDMVAQRNVVEGMPVRPDEPEVFQGDAQCAHRIPDTNEMDVANGGVFVCV